MKKNNFLLVCLLAFSFCLATAGGAFAQNETMTNEEVITLAKAGLNQSIIIDKIKTTKTNFDLSTDSLIKLKQAGVSDAIVTAMLEAKSGKQSNGSVANSTAPVSTRGTGDPNDPMALQS